MRTARVYGLGLGPGDPELVTVKAVRILKEADVVIVPQSDKTGRSLAHEIITPYVSPEKIRFSYFPMTGDKKDLDERYTTLAEDIRAMAAAGKTIAYVTIGDGTIYSTFNYLADRLDGVPLEFVPGIPAVVACANLLGMPLVEKDESFCVIEMPEHAGALAEKIALFDVVAVMKVHKRLNILTEFVSRHKLRSAHLVKRAYLDGEEVIDLLRETPDSDAGYLSVAILKR